MIAVIKKYDTKCIAKNIELLKQFTEYKVNGLFADDITRLKAEAASLYNEVMSFVEVGRWNPFVGMWSDENKYYSEEALCRSILYSSVVFGRKYRAMYARQCYSGSLAKCAYAGRFDSVVIENAENNYWLESTDGSRVFVLSAKDFTDAAEITEEEVKNNEFYTLEEYSKNMLSMPLDLPVIRTTVDVAAYTAEEKAILDYEKFTAWEKLDENENIKNMWLLNRAVPSYEKPAEPYDIKLDVNGVELVALKLSEDGKGNTVLRVRETEGKEKSVRLICDKIEAAFRFEISPYETITFRVDEYGYVTETFIQE